MRNIALNLFLSLGEHVELNDGDSSINPLPGYVESIAADPRALKLEEMTLQLVRFDHISRLWGVNILPGAPRSRRPSQTGIASLAAQAHEESLTQRQKERQLKRRQKEYEGAKQAAARNGLNANMVAPPRYGDVTYDPYNQFSPPKGGGTAQNGEQGSVPRTDLQSQLDAVRQQREQVQRELSRKSAPSK